MLDEHMKYPKWQKPCRAALLEVKRAERSAKVVVAEASVSQRSRELTTTARDMDEHLALRDAAFRLHLLKSQPAKS